ncbi:hypothetical protein V8E54_000509 [Elaphomyces granulatus]
MSLLMKLMKTLSSKMRRQEKVQITTIRRWYHRMMRWVDSYETGAGAVEAQQQVQAFSSKKFKSHRRAPEDDGT